MYKRTVKIDLSHLDVAPSTVEFDYIDPMFLWLRSLPLPPKREAGEDDTTYAHRIGPCPRDVRWVYQPMQNDKGDAVVDGAATCGDYWRKAMETTPEGSAPAMIDISGDGVALTHHAQNKSVNVLKVRRVGVLTCVVFMLLSVLIW